MIFNRFIQLAFLLFISFIISCNTSERIYGKKNNLDNLTDFSEESGYFIDERDSNIYKWVKIGDQIWMAENLAYKSDSGFVAFKNNQKFVNRFGYLYNGKTAQLVCPKGWHLPTKDEYIKLCKYFGENIHDVFYVFKNGNDYGFNSKNAGSYDNLNLNYKRCVCFQIFRIDEYWTSSISYTDSNGINYYNYLTINYFRKIAIVGELGKNENNYYIPIRCIKDEE